MNPSEISHPLDRNTLARAATYLNGGYRYGAWKRLAQLTGTPHISIRHYAAGTRPVPRHLALAVRTLIALESVLARVPKEDAA